MIAVDLPAKMACDEEGCGEALPVSLCLMAAGGFGFKPVAPKEVLKEWQIGAAQNGTFVSYCPAHKQTVQRVQVGPAGLRLRETNGH